MNACCWAPRVHPLWAPTGSSTTSTCICRISFTAMALSSLQPPTRPSSLSSLGRQFGPSGSRVQNSRLVAWQYV